MFSKINFRRECTLVEHTMEHNLSIKQPEIVKKRVYGVNLNNYLKNKFMKAHTNKPYYFGHFHT